MAEHREDRGAAIACVTGATGLIGRQIISRLIDEGFHVRGLAHRQPLTDNRVEAFQGHIQDDKTLRLFLKDAALVFHCAAGIIDNEDAWAVNVNGTRVLVEGSRRAGIQHFVHISSVGVCGPQPPGWVTENASCHPVSEYQKSKYAAEQVARAVFSPEQLTILRPTNVVGDCRPDQIFNYVGGDDLKGKLLAFLKGNECAHLIHADDVAAAAIHLARHKTSLHYCYFVSLDHDPLNTVAGIQAICKALVRSGSAKQVRPGKALPPEIPHVLRKLVRGHSLHGQALFSSRRLLNTGFEFPMGLIGALKAMLECER